MRLYFHEDAEREFAAAVDYYERCRKGLGLEFAHEVYITVARVVRFPAAGTRMSKNTQRSLVHRFPFGVIYQVKPNQLRIIAISNLRRRPGYWRRRK